MAMTTRSMPGQFARFVAGMSAVGVSLTAVPGAHAENYDVGLLLFNSSSYTINIAETANPAPSCVDNQGDIPQPMTTPPGSINQSQNANQNIEFRTNTSCDILSHGNDPLLWQYPFNLYADGQSGLVYTVQNTPGPNFGGACSFNPTGGFYEVGIDGMQCGFFSGTSWAGNQINAWYTGAPLVTFPESQNFYYVITPLLGPALGGTGNACSASNWSSCVLVQVYNTGEGPYADGATGTSTMAATAPSTAMALPAASRPVLAGQRLTAGSRTWVTLTVLTSGVAPLLISQYGNRQLGNTLWALVLAKDSQGGSYNATGRFPLTVTGKTNGKRTVTAAFSAADSRAMLNILRQGGRIEFEIQLRQLISTPKETLELPTRGGLLVNGR